MMLALLSSLALADSITLDTGATIEGDLARYEFGGDCQLSVTEGELTGVILIVPCHRVVSFMRTATRAPVPIGIEEEAARVAAAPAPEVASVELVAEPVADALPSAPIEEPFYDEPLFPVDAATPIQSVAPTAAPPRAPMNVPLETTGPRLAPRMDEMPLETSEPERRTVSF